MKKLEIEDVNSLVRDMKYEALYWVLGFVDVGHGLFTKNYSGNTIGEIGLEEQNATFKGINFGSSNFLSLTTHTSFVVLECIDRLLEMGASPEDISVTGKTDSTVSFRNLEIKCFEWGHIEQSFTNKTNIQILYSSRLVSGAIEMEYFIMDLDGTIYTNGFFERNAISTAYMLSNPQRILSSDFEIVGTTVKKYIGNEATVRIPDGITALSSCLFWDNQQIEEVILPDSLKNLGGDTFYNCKNLKKVIIPENVTFMGNNPFAGCPKLVLENKSPNFKTDGGALYDKDFTRLIYYPIASSEESYEIKSGTKIIGKHAFFLCSKLKEIIIPNSVIKLENNPFSGCGNLFLKNYSPRYNVVAGVIYDSDFSSVIGCLNSVSIDELVLKNVRRICRNSFWNCKGIKKIVLPKTLETIGYNPFVGCTQIEFISKSPAYTVEDGILFNADKSKIICWPAKFAVGEIHVPESVTSLERGAFSGAGKMTGIHLHNVSVISKTCFTNCDSLTEVYCSDFVAYIGEWAFAHCKNLRELSVYKDCFIDKNVILNSPAQIAIRKERTNYVIESDNIHTLKALQSSCEGTIKSILIDPPYNSHIGYIGYKDSDFDGGYERFIEKRIELSYNLLSEDGFLVVNIDEGGLYAIESVCEKIFGTGNVRTRRWKKRHEAFDQNRVVLNPDKPQTDFEYIVFARKSEKAILKKIMQPYFENGRLCEKENEVPETFDCFGTNSSAKDEIAQIFGRRDYFSTPKPVKLLKELVRATTEKDSVVLDFFAGSGTTGHAVTELNREDGGRRTFILVSNNESDICRQVTMKRMEACKAKFTGLR